MVDNTKHNLSVYIDSMLIKKARIIPYNAMTKYDKNTIGCGLKLIENDKELLFDNFNGEMSALYFIEVDNKSLIQVHNTLTYILKEIGLENLADNFDVIAESKAKKNIDINLLEKTFMHINPKYTIKKIQCKQRVHVLSKGYEVFNSINEVYDGTIVCHNTVSKDLFFDIGGVRALVPLISKLIKSGYSDLFVYYFSITVRNLAIEKFIELTEMTLRLSPQKLNAFLTNEKGLLILQYLLERVRLLKHL